MTHIFEDQNVFTFSEHLGRGMEENYPHKIMIARLTMSRWDEIILKLAARMVEKTEWENLLVNYRIVCSHSMTHFQNDY